MIHLVHELEDRPAADRVLAPEDIKSAVRQRYGAIASEGGSCCGSGGSSSFGCGSGDPSLSIGCAG